MAREPDDTAMFDVTETTAPSQPTTQPATATTTTTTTKKKRKPRHPKPHILLQQTLRHPQWTYIHLRHLSPPTPPSQPLPVLDAITAHQHLTTALTQFLGQHGRAIAFDVLKLDGEDVWIRAASEDRRAVVAAAGGWVSAKGEGWRVVGSSPWDAGVGGGRDAGLRLFGE